MLIRAAAPSDVEAIRSVEIAAFAREDESRLVDRLRSDGDILVELGRRKMIGGQEDMIEDTALTMAKARGLLTNKAA